jgi:hypothetical protein
MSGSQPSPNARLRAGVGCITVSIHGNKAVFSELSSTYPLKLLSPSIQDTRAVAYLLTYGGGLVSGDEIALVVNVQLGATLILLSQASFLWVAIHCAFHLPVPPRDRPRSSKRVQGGGWLQSTTFRHLLCTLVTMMLSQHGKTLTFT